MDRTADESTPDALTSTAARDVVSAIGRGRKRRVGPNVSQSAIELSTPSQPTSQPANPAKRQRVSIIPGENDDDDDSNDEWEEDVHLDKDVVEAAVRAVQQQLQEERGKAEEGERKEEVKKEGEGVEEGKGKKGKSRKHSLAAKKRKRALERHSVHLALGIAYMVAVDSAANDDELRVFAISITPQDTLFESGAFIENLSRLVLWCCSHFRYSAFVHSPNALADVNAELEARSSGSSRAIKAIDRRKGDVIDVVSIVAAILRMQGLRCRVVSPLQPVSYQVQKDVQKQINEDGIQRYVMRKSEEASTCGVIYGWLEVWWPEQKKWVPVDLFDGNVHVKLKTDSLKRSLQTIPVPGSEASKESALQEAVKAAGKKPGRKTTPRNVTSSRPLRQLSRTFLAHVVAVENGVVYDVTRRYMPKWEQVESSRARGKIFEKTIRALTERPPDPTRDDARKAELQEFGRLASGDKLPTSVAAVQRHPRYILERHLKKYEVLFPKEPIVGYLKEEPIYLRENVKLLHTKDRWVRQMREVRGGEKPLKSVRSKNGSDAQVDLFGEWQTEALVIPECVDGKVPRGIHGNVDLWTPEHLPKGTVHVNMAFAKVAARKLGIDSAPAMTGFDIRRGRSVPRIEGVVVAAENAGAVQDAAAAAARVQAERLERKAKEEALERWLKLLRTIKARENVKKKYGTLHGFGTTYEQEQKMKGAKRAQQERQQNGGELLESKVERANALAKEKVKRRIQVTAAAHEHEYGEATTVKGNLQMKRCKICNFEVSFESY